MTDVAPATDAKVPPPANAEDAKLAEFGYTQRLDRSVGTLASFAIGFATISATTAVFTGFGAGYFTAGAPFVWTLLLAGAVFALWAFIAADLTAKLPLAGYSYQWISRINGPDLGFFTGFIALMGWVCGMTGVGFILSGYLGGLFGWNMSQSAQILLAIGVVFLCVLINIYGVRFATMVNNIGVSLELVITVGATVLVAVIAFSAPDHHQPFSVLFTGGESGDKSSYMLAWLAAALGPFFGLIGVESGADVAEETKNARYVVPRTMFYALVTSIVIELLMYIVYVLAIRDVDAVAGQYRCADRGDHQPTGRLRHHKNRCRRCVDEYLGVPAGQHSGGDAADLLDGTRQHAAVLQRLAARLAEDQDADLRGDRSRLPVDRVAVVGARQRGGVQLHHRHRVAAVLLRLHPADHRLAGWLPQAAPSPRPSPAPSISAGGGCRCTSPRWWCSSRSPSPCSSCRSSPATSGYSWAWSRRRGVVGHRSAYGSAAAMPGPTIAKTHLI